MGGRRKAGGHRAMPYRVTVVILKTIDDRNSASVTTLRPSGVSLVAQYARCQYRTPHSKCVGR
eukprot:3217877-Rhodomonas_salina.3